MYSLLVFAALASSVNAAPLHKRIAQNTIDSTAKWQQACVSGLFFLLYYYRVLNFQKRYLLFSINSSPQVVPKSVTHLQYLEPLLFLLQLVRAINKIQGTV